MEFCSRRSPLYCTHGCVASSQPLASEIGVRILKAGGNAADAAVAVAAALNVTEPCSTGIGGDCFCLFYDAKTKTVRGLNASGRAPQALSLQVLAEKGIIGASLPPLSIHTVIVPGAAAGWIDTLERFGTKSAAEVLQPAIELAEQGFPLHPVAAHFWQRSAHLLQSADNPHGADLLLDGRAPRAGEVMRNPALAATFRALAASGKNGFYNGAVAEAIVEAVQLRGGLMTMDDLASHTSTFDNPIHTQYKGVDVWEMPPNGQGLTALLALNILRGFDLASMGHNTAPYLHTLIEALRLAFADTKWYVADPAFASVPVEQLLSESYAATRRHLITPSQAVADPVYGSPAVSCDTVYFSVVDGQGNACSFINSNYMGFGTGIVPRGCGFTLQNRGANFSLEPGHPNALAGGKRPFHTIIPGMATKGGELMACFGVMGGFMQPQGHVQVLLNMIEFGMDAQQALDSLRFCIDPESQGLSLVQLEAGIPSDVVAQLAALGHHISVVEGHARSAFGRGQIVRRLEQNGVLEAGSDPRADGCAYGW